MFGLGRNPRRMNSNSTFSSNRLRNAAIAGAGMLALRWWRNRQAQGRNPTAANRSTGTQSDPTTRGWSP
jgi:hypothetical protein